MLAVARLCAGEAAADEQVAAAAQAAACLQRLIARRVGRAVCVGAQRALAQLQVEHRAHARNETVGTAQVAGLAARAVGV